MAAIAKPLAVTHGEFNWPRRNCLDANHEAEHAIRAAIDAVERLGADPLLTDAVTLLSNAKDRVSDWLEGSVG